MSFVRRGLVVVAAVAAAALGAPSMAYAATPDLVLSVHDGGVPEAGKWFSLSLFDKGGSTQWAVSHSKLVIDTSAVADFATAWVANYDEDGKPYPAKYCTPAGNVLTCELGTTYSWGLPSMVVEAKPGAELGSSGPIAISFSGDGVGTVTAKPKITVAADVDLAVTVSPTAVLAKPGEQVIAPVLITNPGPKAVDGAAVRLVGYDGLQRSGNYRNCGYDQGDQQMYCRFDTVLEPGATYVFGDAPLQVRADATPGKTAGYAVQLFTGDDFDDSHIFDGLTPGTAGTLQLVRKATVAKSLTTDSNGANNLAFGRVTVLAATPEGSTPASTPPVVAEPSPAGTGAGGAGGGGLPVTGSPVGLIAGGGVALLALGGLTFVIARRRAGFVA